MFHEKTLVDHLKGINGNGTISWGVTKNETLEQLVASWNANLEEPEIIQSNVKKIKMEKVYLPEYGICYETDDYDTQMDIQIIWENELGYTFVTDKNLRSYPSLAFKTHTGDKMDKHYYRKLTYKVKIDLMDHHDPVINEACKDYTEEQSYEDCVNDELKAMLLPKLGCMPPWLSPDNQCLGVYTGGNFTIFNATLNDPNFVRNVVEPTLYKHRLAVESQCMQPCVTTKINVEQVFEEFFLKLVFIIKFDEDATLTKTVVTYHLSDFAVDVGSLLGFWLGLSVFGLTDLLENFGLLIKSLLKKLF